MAREQRKVFNTSLGDSYSKLNGSVKNSSFFVDKYNISKEMHRLNQDLIGLESLKNFESVLDQ